MTYWLSFADEHGFKGVIVVDCETFGQGYHAVTTAGINPGGQMAGFGFAPDDPRMSAEEHAIMAALPRMKLLQKEDLTMAGLLGMSLEEAEAAGTYNMQGVKAGLERVCEDCNETEEQRYERLDKKHFPTEV